VNSRVIVLNYMNYIESYEGVEDFDIIKRSKYTKSFIGRNVQKIKVAFSLFLLTILRPPKKKYIFHANRFPDITDLIPEKDCMIIDSLACFFKNIFSDRTYIWGGGIIASFELAMYLDEYRYLNKTISMIGRVLPDKKDKGFLFLYEDTQPLGRVLSSVFRDSSDILTICIAHAFFPTIKKGLVLDGNNSNINFVWSATQKVFFDENKTIVISLGLPYNYKVSKKIDLERIVLLGYSGPATNYYEYFLTYAHLIYIYKILKNNNFNVKFKPHPQDKDSFPQSVFGLDVVHSLKEELENGSVFAGFSSSAMYEAKKHGSIVIGLDTKLLSQERCIDYNRNFLHSEYDLIPDFLDSLSVIKEDSSTLPFYKLSERFQSAMQSSMIANKNLPENDANTK
jgi:hypothetical protein